MRITTVVMDQNRDYLGRREHDPAARVPCRRLFEVPYAILSSGQVVALARMIFMGEICAGQIGSNTNFGNLASGKEFHSALP